MISESREGQQESLTADKNTPWINVWQLAETTFCDRAGALALEDQSEDRGEDRPATARLDYVPDYDLALIEEQLEALWEKIHRASRWALWYALLAIALGLMLTWSYTVLAVLPLYFPARWLVGQLRIVRVLGARRRAALAATRREPDPDSSEVQQINWWDLRRADFQMMRLHESLPDKRLRLAGKPWGMLQKNNFGIPVFRKHFGQRKISRQHFARLAAYCHLIEQSEGLQSPYGIVLFHDSYDVLVIPNSPASRKAFHAALRRARQLAASEAERSGLQPPDDTSCCQGCRWGKPRRYLPGKSETVLMGKTWQPLVTNDHRRRPCHSSCGDRYGWVPPHEQAQTLGLLD